MQMMQPGMLPEAVRTSRWADLGVADWKGPDVTRCASEVSKFVWPVAMTKEARQGWAQMPDHDRKEMGRRLQEVGMGSWWQSKAYDRLIIHGSGKQGLQQYSEGVRVWSVTASFDEFAMARDTAIASHKRAKQALHKRKLQPVARIPVTGMQPSESPQRVPQRFTCTTAAMVGADQDGAAHCAADQLCEEREMEMVPPAHSNPQQYTMIKMFNMDGVLVRSALMGLQDMEVELPFKLSEEEWGVVMHQPMPPAPTLLLGRSGTGKTTVIVYSSSSRAPTAMEPEGAMDDAQEDTEQHDPTDCDNNDPEGIEGGPIFVTRSRTLKEQVRKAFRRMQLAVLQPWDMLAVEASAEGVYHSMQQVPTAAFPLFLISREYLNMLDGTLAEPFQPRHEDGSVVQLKESDEGDGEDTLVELEVQHAAGTSSPEPTQGHLDLAQYEGLGRKRAATFTSEQRRDLVWPVFQAYQQALRAEGRYDQMDLVAHMHRAFREGCYCGAPITAVFRDEVQDFTQAELALDFEVVVDANELFYCGDTAQTIARGIGFRFTDIRAMFYELSQAQQAAIRDAKKARQGHRLAGPPAVVGVPQIQQLLINHRTHQGILNAAAVVVDALKHYYPAGIDSLARERAHFQGPGPVLEGSLSSTDIRPLLQQAGAQMVDFGAHQVFLLRDRSQRHELPEYLRKSNALMLTVPQAKGLEFEEVFMVDFFKHSPASEAEWRVLNSFCPAGAQPSSLRSTKFDPSVHLLLQEELKMLYTAITRARCHLIICDDSEKSTPFYDMITRCGYGNTRMDTILEAKRLAAVDQPVASKQHSASRPDGSLDDFGQQWHDRAMQLLDKEDLDSDTLEMASRAFTSAGDPVRSAAVLGRSLRMLASELRPSDPMAARSKLQDAAFHLMAAVRRGVVSAMARPVKQEEVCAWARAAAQCLRVSH
ncbi:P-loop containing nucleoside triphosphate hydrolase protein [Haematococcus lacustris]